MTTERTTVVQKTQIGVESTIGTAVAANKRLQALSIEFEPQAMEQEFTPLGNKFPTVVVEQKEWMQATLKGYPSFGDLIYCFSSAFSAATVTQFMDSATPTGCYKWVFDMSSTLLDTPKGFTIEQGDGVRAMRFPGALIRQLGLKFNRQTVDLSGQIIGKQLEDGITMTASPSDVELQPLLASNFDVYIDPTFGALGTTKAARLFDGDWTLDGRYGPIWPVDSAQASYANTVETQPSLEFKPIFEADSAGMGYLSTFRAGSTVFCRIKNVGPTIYSAGVYVSTPLKYQFTMDMALKVHAIDKFQDQDGVYAIGFNFRGVDDSGWGKAIHVEIQNKTAAL